MKNLWYGDLKDHVKWQSLMQIARGAEITRVYYVVMRTESMQAGNVVSGLEGGPEVDDDISAGVNNYFRWHNVVELVKPMGAVFGIEIELEARRFTDATRAQFFERVLHKIQGPNEPTVWFFDPDTGMETAASEVGVKHVALDELRCAYGAMPAGHRLVCFQNSWRDANWRTLARQRLAGCLGIEQDQVDVYGSGNVPNVIMLAVRKA